MKKLTAGIVTAVAMMALSGVAGAEESGVELGARSGYGIPMGDALKDKKMSDGVDGMIPIWIDAGYRINPNLFAGVYFQYGLVSVADKACGSGADCSASDIRIGLQGQYHIMPDASFDPWVGLGVGYEMLKSSAEAGGSKFSRTMSGFEFANLQAGADFEVAPGFGVGPFISFSLGQYSSSESDPNPTNESSDIKDKAMHQWLLLGVKGSYSL